MSRETQDWLSNNTLIGFTDKRGHAWHHREGDQNTYPGAIPVGDVKRRLFDWEIVERPIYVPSEGSSFAPIPDHKAIVRSDNGHVMGIFKDSYQRHLYDEWLLDNVESILDDSLAIGSAGLLKGGAVAWVSVEVPDTITTPEGIQFRPNLLAVTSADGTIATTYKPVVTNVVCDNTMRAGLSEKGRHLKTRHSSKSLGRIAEAREALGIVFDIADDFAAEVKALCEFEFTNRQFDELAAQLAPHPPSTGDYLNPSAGFKRAVTRADNKRDELHQLWAEDSRVTPWRGTAYGAWQAVSTHQQHVSAIHKATNRAERNMLRAVDGRSVKDDTETLEKILQLA
jgi:phage/plasmid-like protein (TIGR03299 family)